MKSVRKTSAVSFLLMLLVFAGSFVPANAEEIVENFDALYATEEFLEYGSGLRFSEGGISTGGVEPGVEIIPQELEDELLRAAVYVPLVTSDEGVNLIAKWEGCVLTAYKDLSGVWTIGYGHTGSDVAEGMTITQEQAIALLKSDISRFEGYVNNFCKKNSVVFTQSQFDAMVSFTYNVGTTWISDSTIRTYILNGITNYTDQQIIDAISMWSYSNHQFIQGLYNRRQEEGRLFVRDLDRGAVIEAVSLNLEGKIGLCFYVAIPESISTQYGAVVWIQRGNDSFQCAVSEGFISAGKYKYSIFVPVRNLNDDVRFCILNAYGYKLPIKNANSSDNEYICSVQTYIDSARASADLKLKNLADALYAYSQSVRLYFGDIVSTDINTNVSLDAAELENDKIIESGAVTGLTRVGSSLILESDTCIRHYFSLEEGRNINDYTFLIGQTELAPRQKGTYYYIDISNIPAERLSERFIVNVIDKRTGEVYSLSYSALSYVYSVFTNQRASRELRGLGYYLRQYARVVKEFIN